MNPERLKQVPLFSDLSEKELVQVGKWADEVDVAEGKHLIDEGQFGYEFFVIEEGKAEVKRGDDVIAELGPGDFFGEMALLEADRRNASVIATSPLRTIVMTRRDFAEMQAEMPGVCDQIHQAVESRRET
ncbi:MAG: cyclic nucleotide-binding domain-containing protein [Actinomycetota bacterium]